MCGTVRISLDHEARVRHVDGAGEAPRRLGQRIGGGLAGDGVWVADHVWSAYEIAALLD